MIEQNLQVSQTISENLMTRALALGLEQVAYYGVLYRDAIVAFKDKYFEDRKTVALYLLINVLNLSHKYLFLGSLFHSLHDSDRK